MFLDSCMSTQKSNIDHPRCPASLPILCTSMMARQRTRGDELHAELERISDQIQAQETEGLVNGFKPQCRGFDLPHCIIWAATPSNDIFPRMMEATASVPLWMYACSINCASYESTCMLSLCTSFTNIYFVCMCGHVSCSIFLHYVHAATI